MDKLQTWLRSPEDYWKLGPVYVWKWLALLLLAAACILILILFGLPRGLFPSGEAGPPAYRYDDGALASVSGTVRILDGRGNLRYEGEVSSGACTGTGRIYDEAGRLVYEGPLAEGVCAGPGGKVYAGGLLVYEGDMADNRYQGEGRRTAPGTGIVSEGSFSAGVFQGEGREFYPDGALLREGTFARELLNGPGREYGRDGKLLREGTFSDGLLHGTGTQYAPGGALLYEGEFRFGLYHGQGRLYDGLRQVLVYEGEFLRGRALGTGRTFHPGGQLLYEGPVYDGQPRAAAFLGLSLAEVEAAFKEHWLLYAWDGAAAFVYPYFQLMFVTETPVPLVSRGAQSEQSRRERQELLDALRPPEDGGEEEPGPEAVPAPLRDYGDDALFSDARHGDILIGEVLSYGAPLPGAPQPEAGDAAGQHEAGWREWFCRYASGESPRSAAVRRTGPFVFAFTESEPREASPLGHVLALEGGVQTMTVRREAKDEALWYQSAVRKDPP